MVLRYDHSQNLMSND